MTEGDDRLAALRRERRKRHRLANVTFLLAGLGFGSAAYVARTRPLTGRMTMWLGVVGAGVAVFGMAAWLLSRAHRLDDEIAALEEERRAARDE